MPVRQTTERWIVQPDGSKIRGVVGEISKDVSAETVSAAPEPSVQEPEAQVEVESYPVPRTHAEADEQAAERGVEFPEDVQTVKEKQEFLASLD